MYNCFIKKRLVLEYKVGYVTILHRFFTGSCIVNMVKKSVTSLELRIKGYFTFTLFLNIVLIFMLTTEYI